MHGQSYGAPFVTTILLLTKAILSRQKSLLSYISYFCWTNYFCRTKITFVDKSKAEVAFVNKSNFCRTKVLLSRQINFCQTKATFVMQQYFYRQKYFCLLQMAWPFAKCYTFVDRSTYVQQNILLSDKSRFRLGKSTFDQQKLVMLIKVTFVKTGVTLVEKSKFCWQKQLLSCFCQQMFILSDNNNII